MTKEERMAYKKAIKVIDYKVLNREDYIGEPTSEQLNAITLAVKSMERRMQDTGLPLAKHIAVLRYHIHQPTALLFKDTNTMDALEAGILAMKWQMKDDMYDNL